jgi:hypothetical protein
MMPASFATVVATLLLGADALLARGAAPAITSQDPTPAAAPVEVLLSNRFVPGRTRRYRVSSTTVTTTGRQGAKNPILDEFLKDRPVPPVESATITFDEEERCASVSRERMAEVSYRCLGFAIQERIGEQQVLDLEVRRPEDLVKLREVPRYLALGALMEAPISFTIDAKHVVHSVKLPGQLAAPQESLLIEEYRRNLQSRYQAFFPDEAVRPGARWSRKLSTGSAFWGSTRGSPDAQLECEIAFLRLEDVAGKTCAVLEVSMNLPLDEERVLHRSTLDKLVCDELSGRSEIRFEVSTGTPTTESTRVVFRMRRILGTAQTEPIEIPIRIEQSISASWLGTTDGLGTTGAVGQDG